LRTPSLRVITRKPLRGDKLDPENPRARSALLRIAERLPPA
jgi:16S rRNA C1402 N4-methylase RsmH